MKEKILKLSRKWWFWLIVAIVVLGIIGCFFGDPESENGGQDNAEKNQYTLVGGETGEYGRKVVLNANTDLPATKYLYKIPAGTYKVTTTFEKLSEFYTVKDNTVNTGTPEYPEELSYVGGPYDLTSGTDDFNGRASKEVTLTLAEDESVLINGTETLIFVLEE